MTFTIADILTILPEIIIAGGASLLLLVAPFVKDEGKGIIAFFSIAFILLGAWFSYHLIGTDATFPGGMFVLDGYATFFKFIFYIATVLTILLSLHYGRVEGIGIGEYYILLLFSLSGMMTLASGADLLTIYLGIELMTLPVYVLVGFARREIRSNEAAMKYVILGAFSSAILLYGISLVYGLTGTTQLGEIATAISGSIEYPPLFSIAVTMLIVGFGFKIASVPFHMWAP
ncbi:MAG: NADH-quinone oxidoreductase subunit N, partial [Deltaproteobacteria bacterium]|nr:NADH-quinone oxidoreductase subunit N [Deltaproteobacteria bacterium]